MDMIIIMGLPGSGKSTVLNALRSKRNDYAISNYGDLMLDIEKSKGWVKTRDEMRKLPIEKQKMAQKLVAKKLAKEKGKFVLDTHCSINTPNGYYPGLPFEFLKGLDVEALVYVTASLDEIKQRRINDPNRVRDVDNIEEHDSMNRYYLAAYSAFTGAPAVIIYNKQGAVEEAVAKLGNLLKSSAPS